MGSTTLISSAFTALLNCAEVGRRNRILTNYRFLSHSLFYVKLLGNQMIDLDVLVFDLELIEASVIIIAFEENVISNGQLDLV